MKPFSFTAIAAVTITLAACSSGTPAAAPAQDLKPTDSVVKIDATSEKCGVIEHGSGFVVGEDKVMTNAHVVAGANQIDVSSSLGKQSGKVVYFDPNDDLAIVSVPGLGLAALSIGEDLVDKTSVTLNGYPLGKEFAVTAATKLRTLSWQAHDIYGAGSFSQSLYELDAAIQHGNSGGPVLDDSDLVRGVVLGKASDTKAYAITIDQVKAALAADQTAKITNSKCLPK